MRRTRNFVRLRLLPEYFQVLNPQLTHSLVSQSVDLAPFGCTLPLFNFAHSALCSFLSRFAEVREGISCLHSGTSMCALCGLECKFGRGVYYPFSFSGIAEN